jgi:hypothetical protein
LMAGRGSRHRCGQRRPERTAPAKRVRFIASHPQFRSAYCEHGVSPMYNRFCLLSFYILVACWLFLRFCSTSQTASGRRARARIDPGEMPVMDDTVRDLHGLIRPARPQIPPRVWTPPRLQLFGRQAKVRLLTCIRSLSRALWHGTMMGYPRADSQAEGRVL